MYKNLKATIFYKMDENHPDKDYVVGGWEKDKVYSHSDIYDIDENAFWSEDAMYDYIKNDLALIAGGGYNTKHIYDVRYEFG